MKKKIKVFLLIILFFTIFIFGIYKIFFKKEIFPENNIIIVKKTENILKNNDFFSAKRPEKIVSKGFFIKENLVLTVAHGVDIENDNYKIFLNDKTFFDNAKLIYKDEEKDFAILKTNKILKNFEIIKFGYLNENQIYYFAKNNIFKKIDISKKNKENIFINKEFFPGDSGTIFFSKDKKVIGILSEYDLNSKIGIIKKLNKKILENF